ncbi:hypothetical protein [Chryseobacterium vaccae]|uniref:hypothetical protein n=1 Tax=Chryseobacterium vaccae TaxID=2604424 RepID=UPI001297964D|nr:hypothetical protein [Chryseobacterium vaccae]
MDIVKHIKEHTGNLQKGLISSSIEQRKNLIIALLNFYFLLDDFEEVTAKYIYLEIDKKQLISDIRNEKVKQYQEANEKSLDGLDEYADDYEEPEPVEIFILDALGNAVCDINSTENIVGLFIGVIDALDYFENFLDEPEFWNDVLEKEVNFQNEILSEITAQEKIDPSVYHKRYGEIMEKHKL